MRHLPLLVSVVCVGALCCFQVGAAPRLEPLELDDAPGVRCASEPELLARTEERLGRPLVSSAGAVPVAAQVRRWRDAAGWHAQVRLVAGADSRALGERAINARGPTCDALDASLVLVLALLFDTVPENVATHEQAPVTPPAAPLPAAQPAPEAPRLWRWHFGVTAGSAVGFLPGLAWGVGLATRLQSPVFDVGLEVLVWPDVQQREGVTGSDYWAVSARPGGCLHLIRGEPWLGLCGAASLAVMSIAPFGFQENQPARRFVLSPGLGARVGKHFGAHWLGWLELAAEVPIFRQRFSVSSGSGAEREWYAMSPIAALLTAGVDRVGW